MRHFSMPESTSTSAIRSPRVATRKFYLFVQCVPVQPNSRILRFRKGLYWFPKYSANFVVTSLFLPNRNVATIMIALHHMMGSTQESSEYIKRISSGNEGTKLYLESRELLKDLFNPKRKATYVSLDEGLDESLDTHAILFQSRKNTLTTQFERPELSYSVKEEIRPRDVKNTTIRFIRKRIQFFAFLISVTVGVILGLLLRLRKEKYSEFELFIIRFPGIFYVRTLSGMLMPLIAASTVSSLARLNFKLGFEIFWRFSLHAFIFKIFVITFAMVLTLVMEPGNGVTFTNGKHGEIVTTDFLIMLTDTFRNAIPDKFIVIFYESSRTKVVYTGPPLPDDIKSRETLLSDPSNWTYILKSMDFPNYIGLIACSVGVGFGLQRLYTTNRLILRLTISVENILVRIGDWFLSVAAIGKFSLLIAAVVSYDIDSGPQDIFPYVATVIGVCFFHMFIIAPLYFYLMTFVNPWPYYKHIVPVLFTAFATASSVVTLPSTVNFLEEDGNLGNIPCRLMAPFGAVVNMDGAAIHLAVTAVFIAQALKHNLTIWDLFSIWLNSFVQSINISPVPHDASLAAVFRGLLTVGIHSNDFKGLIKKLESVDELLDRFRSVTNVYGDIMTALIVHFAMVRAVENKRGLVSVDEFLEKQEFKRRMTIIETQTTLENIRGINKNEQNVVKGPVTNNEDLELLSVSSTSSEERLNKIEL